MNDNSHPTYLRNQSDCSMGDDPGTEVPTDTEMYLVISASHNISTKVQGKKKKKNPQKKTQDYASSSPRLRM